jgi:photosynthetic reaction center H subunit
MNDDRTDLHLDRTPSGRLDEALPGSALTPLRRLRDYRIAHGDPDVRGWQVLGADGRPIGEVDDLLVDTEALRVRYLDVALDAGLLAAAPVPEHTEAEASEGPIPGLAPEETMVAEGFIRSTLSAEENELTRERPHGYDSRHVLIPIGKARLDPEHDRVVLQEVLAADAAGFPDYRGQTVSRDYETDLRQRLDQAYTHSQEHDFYAHDLYDEDRFYSPRRQAARVAGLAPGRSAGASAGREVTGELDRAVNAPDRSQAQNEAQTRDVAGVPQEEASLPTRSR